MDTKGQNMNQLAQIPLGQTVKGSHPERMLQIFSQVFPAVAVPIW